MRRIKKKYRLSSVRDKTVYDLERRLLAKYGLKNKKELGRGVMYLEKLRKLYFRREQQPIDYCKNLERNIKLGFIERGNTILDMNIDSYFSRTLCYLLSKANNFSIRQSRKMITSGQVFYRGYRLRSPRTIIPLEFEKEIILR